MWIPLLQSTPFPCPTLPLSPCPLLCAYYNTIFFRPSIILCVHENRVCSFFFVLFSAVFGFVFPAFSLHIFTAKQIFWQATDRNWQAHEQWTGKCMASTHKTDRDRDREMERWREGPQLTVCLSLQLIDRSQSQSQSQSRQSDRKQNRLLCLPACPMWKMIPAVKRSTYRPGHLAMLSCSLSDCPTVPLPVVCRLSCRVIARRCCYYCCCLTFQWFFSSKEKKSAAWELKRS